MIGVDEVVAVHGLCLDYLDDRIDRDWSIPVPDLELTVGAVVAHLAQGNLWYSIDLTAGGLDLEVVEVNVKPDGPPELLTGALRTSGTILVTTLRTAPEEARGFHPFGLADTSGFAAMTCDEHLIHTHDVALAFEEDFHPPEALSRAVLTRLFPWVTVDRDPWDLLRWANGRLALPDRERLTKWRWHCAPLTEWDGSDAP